VKWFRLYSEMMDDPKMSELSPTDFQIFIYLLCLACELEKKGSIDLPLSQISYKIRRKPHQIETVLERLSSLKIIEMNHNGFRFINWNKRQFQSDNVNERVRKHRSGNVTRNVTKPFLETLHETAPDTDTETETDNNPRKSPPGKADALNSEIAKDDRKPVSDNKHFSVSSGEYAIAIEEIGKRIAKHFPDVWKWIQIQLRKKVHPYSVQGVLTEAEPYLESSKSPFAYLEAVMKTKGPNYKAKIAEREAEGMKIDFNLFVAEFQKFMKNKT